MAERRGRGGISSTTDTEVHAWMLEAVLSIHVSPSVLVATAPSSATTTNKAKSTDQQIECHV